MWGRAFPNNKFIITVWIKNSLPQYAAAHSKRVNFDCFVSWRHVFSKFHVLTKHFVIPKIMGILHSSPSLCSIFSSIMNPNHFFFLVLIFFFFSMETKGQEEFFGNKNGVSLSYSQGNKEEARDISLSAYLKNVILGVGLQSSVGGTYPVAALIICPNFKDSASSLKTFVGFQLGFGKQINFAGMGIGLSLCFFRKSNLPLSINFSANCVFAIQDKRIAGFSPAINVGYTQAFFAKSPVYPVLGISNSYFLEDKTQVFFIHLGINYRIG